jgi:hypothetical protein
MAELAVSRLGQIPPSSREPIAELRKIIADDITTAGAVRLHAVGDTKLGECLNP